MKKHLYPSILLAATYLLSQTGAYAQSFPKSMYLAEDEHILYTNGQQASGVYDESVVKTIELWFDQTNYWQLLTNNYQSKLDIAATFISEGDTLHNVGVRFKGQTSYSMASNSQKKSFNITFNTFTADQKWKGYETFNLNNAFEDASFMREVSYLHQIRKHVPAAKASYVRLYLNGQDWGVYPNVQQLNSDYIEEWFFGNDGIRWRADRPSGTGGGGPGGGGWGDGTAALNYLGADTALYKQYYDLKASKQTNPWSKLVEVCQVLNQTPLDQLEDAIKNVMDLDRTLWFLATEIAFSDDDSYVYKGKMDYYVYWDPETGRLTPLEFDGNSVMKSNATTWSPFYNANKVNYPLLNRLLAVPSIRQRYLAHFRTIIKDEMTPAQFNALIDQYDALIASHVQSDPKKLYTVAQYNTEKTTLKNFVNTHRNTLLGNTEMAQIGIEITAAHMSSNAGAWVNPSENETPWVTASVSTINGLSGMNVWFSPAVTGNFAALQMYDDGQHQDGAAGDGTFGVQLPGYAAGTFVRFYIESIASNTAQSRVFLPEGAEHNVFYYIVGAAWASERPVRINEIMAINANTAADGEDEYEDWIEIHNITNEIVDMSDYYLTDNAANVAKWQFPAGTAVAPNGYLIVWADEDASQGPLHANFKLSGSGESIQLLNNNRLLLDTVSFGQQISDQGYARVPNGTGPFKIQTPTFGSNNNTVSVDGSVDVQPIAILPNPANDILLLDMKNAGRVSRLMVLNIEGKPMIEAEVEGSYRLNVADWPNGLYVIIWGNRRAKLVVAH